MAADLPPLRALAGRPYAVDLGRGAEPEVVIRRLAPVRHLAVLWGRWFGGGVLVSWNPVRIHSPARAADGWHLLDDQPVTTSAFDGLGGGWLACLGYADATSWLGFYDFLLRHRPDDHWVFETLGLVGRKSEQQAALSTCRDAVGGGEPPPADDRFEVGVFTSRDPDASVQADYLATVEEVIGRIDRGDFYQMNLCTRLAASFSGDPTALFAQAAARLQPDYGGFAVTGDGRAIAGLSPERFLSVHGDQVLTSPIKGTSSRGADPTGATLRRSTKDAAENIMITDLMRNDLSRVCWPGSVGVCDLLDLEPHPGVWHLVSSVTGSLRPGTSRAELLEATFPPGSVTGAPKISAMRAIAELEPLSRRAYTGAFGLFTPTAGAELNVIIRTFEIAPGRIELGVGGGITVDSVGVREWYECLDKAAPLVAAVGSGLAPQLRPAPPAMPAELAAAGVIETLLAVRGVVLRLSAHLARLDRSCRELYGSGVPAEVGTEIQSLAVADPRPRLGLRVTARPGAEGLVITTEAWPLGPRRTRSTLVLGRRPDWSWRHKWADRAVLHDAEHRAGSADPYFLAPEGHVAETSRGNLFCQLEDGVWRTPPADEHLLPGVTRREVLDLMSELGIPVKLERLGVEALDRARAAFWTSSLSGLVPVEMVNGSPLGSADLPATLIDHLVGGSSGEGPYRRPRAR